MSIWTISFRVGEDEVIIFLVKSITLTKKKTLHALLGHTGNVSDWPFILLKSHNW